MDPNVTLDEIRGQLRAFYEDDLARFNGATLAQSVANLDNWITHKAFLPAAWKHPNHITQKVSV
jgi:hypothetical protein